MAVADLSLLSVRSAISIFGKVRTNWPRLLLLPLIMIPGVLLQLLIDQWNLPFRITDLQGYL